MREVLVPTGFARQLRACRRPIVAIAVGLVVLQALLAGLAAAQAAAMLGDAPFEAGVICHGADGGADAPDNKSPGTSGHGNVCCVFCASTFPTAAIPDAATVAEPPRPATRPLVPEFIVTIARGAVRAGLSRAPPSIA